ncbi:sulfurtransferase [Haloplasma contractile]|uniref:Sulfurtransferase n=1 Tax=Haloplasma contractile SSD-17B TaxID=1033810 RepID=U2DXS0_9MOLU|nr:sulfurtransferase [Haloplasma contractile]ERJ13052.1 thiosulfate-3-mercaptopyruvate sulfurtransferase protein [Haloplasma contractile SSD-17B]
MKKRLLVLLLFMLLILFMTYRFELNGGNKDKNRLFTSIFTSLVSKPLNEKKEEHYVNKNSIISVKELKKNIEKEKVELIAITEGNIFKEFIPDSSQITLSDITTTRNNIDGLIASREKIESLLSKKGLEESDTIVVYDENQSLYAARLWWTLKAYGHADVKLLNGGLKEWKNQGYETVSVPKIERKSNYKATPLNEEMIASLEDIKNSLNNKEERVVDVRTKKEYNNGHIPGAVNVPWSQTLNDDGTFKKASELRKLYRTKGITQELESIYTQCTKGVRASHTYFVLSELLGYNQAKVYDGSFKEYSKSGLPIEKD